MRKTASGRSSRAGLWLAAMLLALGGAAPALAQGQAQTGNPGTPEARAALQRGQIAYQAKDMVAARRELEAACDGQNASACALLGALQSEGLGGPKDERAARIATQKSCTGGYLLSCFQLGWMRDAGRGGPKDHPGAREAYAIACNTGAVPDACLNLGYMMIAGRGGPKDEPKARQMMQMACNGSNAVGCYSLATLFMAPPVDQGEEKAARAGTGQANRVHQGRGTRCG